MDPRHPEVAIDRIDQLVNQFKLNLDNMRAATTSAQLGQLEREGGLVVQEICLVAPRLHEAMMQASRQRRYDLSHGVVEKPVEKSQEKCEKEAQKQPEKCDETEVKPVKTKAKKTTKKKTTKKAKK